MLGALALSALSFAACGDDAEPVDTTEDAETTEIDAPGELIGVTAVPIDQVRVLDEDTLEVTVSGQPEPCFIIDRVDKQETLDQITLAVFAGSEPDAICIEILEVHTTIVELDTPLDDRTIVDQTTGLPAPIFGPPRTPDPTTTSTAAASSTTTAPEQETATTEPTTTTEVEVTTGEARLVNVAAVPIDQVRVLDEDTLEVTVSGQPEPCFIIDRVDKQETLDQITLAVFAGSEPDAICIEILEVHTTIVELDTPLDDRTIVDQTTGLPAPTF